MYHLLLLDVYHFHHHHHSHCKGFWIPIDWNTCAYILDIISNNLSNCRQPTFDDFQSSIRGYLLVYLVRTKLNAPRFTVCFKSSNVYRSAHVGFFLFYSNLFTPWGFRSRRTIYLSQRSRPCVLLACFPQMKKCQVSILYTQTIFSYFIRQL